MIRRKTRNVLGLLAVAVAIALTYASGRFKGREPLLGVHWPRWPLAIIAAAAGMTGMILLAGIMRESGIPIVSRTSDWIRRLNEVVQQLSGAPAYLILFYIFLLFFGGQEGGWQLILALLFTTYLLFQAIRRMVTTQGRQRTFEELQALGWLVPFAYSLLILFLGVVFFATLTLQLYRLHLVNIEVPGGANITTRQLSYFYLWHVADAVPLIEVTKTTKWTEPFQYSDHRVGGLVLFYKLIIILPLVGAFTSFWSLWRSRDQSRQAPDLGPNDMNDDNPKPP